MTARLWPVAAVACWFALAALWLTVTTPTMSELRTAGEASGLVFAAFAVAHGLVALGRSQLLAPHVGKHTPKSQKPAATRGGRQLIPQEG